MALPTNATLWLGTEESFDAYQAAVAKLAANASAFADSDGLPSLLELQGDVAVIHASGPLIEGNAGFLRFFGVTGYQDLQDAGIAAVSNPDVKAIVLRVASNGGHVHGVQEASNLFAQIDKVKPVVTFTPSDMKSAGMWFGASARRIFGAETSESGSIGVLAIHAEKTKALADAGMKVTVIRAGSSKALANPYEPLSAKAEAQIQDGVDYMHGLFKAHMADRRGMSAGQIEKVGQGQVFIGAQAVAAGLIDQVGTLADAISYARSQVSRHAGPRGSMSRSVDSPRGATHNPTASEDPNMKLTPAQAAALAAGATMEAVLAMASTETDPPAKTAEELAAEAAAAKKAEDDAAAAKLAADEAAKQAAEPKTDVHTYMAGQVASLGEQLGAAKAKIASLEAEAAKQADAYSGLVAIAQASLGNMQIALNSPATASALTGVDLLAEHKRISDVFATKYPVGGVAAAGTALPKPKPVPLNPMFAHVVNAAPKN